MRKFMPSALVTLAAAALTVGLGATSSGAATARTWTVKPGGAIGGSASNPTLKDQNTGTVLTCKTFKASGTAKSGSGLSGTGIAKISKVSFNTCTGPLGLSFTVTPAHLPWSLDALSYTASTGVTKGKITGAHATLKGSGCSAVVDGTSATADNGSVSGTYTNSKHQLKTLTTGGNLHIYHVSGCFGLIANGDTATLSGTATISPAQTITSP
ncbi:MAG TPA: hypothetical protein VGI74_09425 [Streptosporangiaceae bacterium]|jgi:hypothetical protein